MGNTHVKPHPRSRNKKQVHWKAADRPSPPGKPSLAANDDDFPADVVTIRWPKPSSDGGSPITSYLVEHRLTGAPHWQRSGAGPVVQPQLAVGGLEPGWRYQFRVRAENAVGMSDPGPPSEPFTCAIERSAVVAPKFIQELRDTTALENEKAEFAAHFLGQPPPKVCWYKDGFEIFSSRRTRITTEPDRSTLTIHQAALADEGEIKCTATNRAGHAATKARLTLEAPPTVRLPRQYEDGLLFEIGELMRLKVSVAGRPTPLLFWHHNGEALHDDDRHEMTFSERSSVLKIEEARRDDRGEYLVRAVNKLGEDSASFLVTVTDRPSPPGKARVVMTLGRSVTLSWQTPRDDGGCKIGNYIVEYYRVGWNVWLKAATSRQLSTVLGDLIEGSEYKFRVKAESPYGVSDPCEETEVVFIPDPKRGILTPERSRSQPRDPIVEQVMTPVAARRRNKPRSLSGSRAQTPQPLTFSSTSSNEEAPKRPERTKPKTPQASPRPKRKEMKPTGLDSEIFDRASMQEMAYGSPEIKVKKTELETLTTDYLLNYSSGSSDRSARSRSPSPFVERPKTQGRRVSIYSIEHQQEKPSSPANKEPTPPRFTYEDIPPNVQRKLSKQHSENMTGSSEFMLVLYPDGNEKDSKDAEDCSFDFGDELIPPPMSLSAPELGSEPPSFGTLRRAISSSELLHERAMYRFYQAMQAREDEEEEEAAKQKQAQERKQSVIPIIQINSQDESNGRVGLEREHSLRRRKSLSGAGQQRALWARKRHSLRGTNDIMEVVEQKLGRGSNLSKMDLSRQRSESEENQEPTLRNVREDDRKMHTQQSVEKRKFSVTPEEEWDEEGYEESLSESVTETESEDERPSEPKLSSLPYFDEEQEETYNPRMRTIVQTSAHTEEPFEILTKRKEPPSPDFVPKPILKKVENENMNEEMAARQQTKEQKNPIRTRTHSPMPSFSRSVPTEADKSGAPRRERSISLTASELEEEDEEEEPIPRGKVNGIKKGNKSTSERKNSLLGRLTSGISNPKRERSVSLTTEETISKPRERSVSLTGFSASTQDEPKKSPSPESSNRNISTAAALSGIAAAGIVIPKELLRRKADEDAKVVIDHYGDIVKNYSMLKKRQESKDSSESKYESDEVENPLYAVAQQAEQADAEKSKQEQKAHAEKVTPKLQKAPSDEYEPTLEEIMLAEPSNTVYDSEKLKTKQVAVNPNPKPETNIQEKEIGAQIAKDRTMSPKRNESPKQPNRVGHVRTPSSSRSSSKTRKKERSASKSPHRLENWSSIRIRKKSPSPADRHPGKKSHSPSPVMPAKRRPMMKEIMTQTSIGLESTSSGPGPSSFNDPHRQEQLIAKAEIKVRSTMDYLTDLAMFIVACWLYLHHKELFAIPVLIFMVYRQVAAEIPKWIPKWIKRRFKKKKKKN